jgi:CubicO group peptidase (beta-lactamase class C family)
MRRPAHRLARCLVCRLVLLVSFLPLVATAAPPLADAPPLAEDPRVADAVTAWTAWVDYQLGADRVPGASLAVVHDQETIVARGLGLANPRTGRAADADTLYSICSISKLFTAVSVMRLRDTGAVTLDESISSYLDWYDLEDAHPGDEAITLRRILTHSSGLPRESDHPYWTAPDYDFPTHEEIAERLAGQRTLYPSGRYFQYSNLGITLAGEVVGAVSGKPWGDYVRDEVLAPLAMEDTYTEIPEQHRGARFALGHSALGHDGQRREMPFFQAQGIAPAAGMASTARDLARFAAWQFRLLGAEDGGGEGEATEVLRPATLREMQRVHWVDPDWEATWGLGFAVFRAGDHSRVSHSGACPGYYSRFLLDPKEKLAVVVLTNAMGAEVGAYTGQGLELIAPQVRAAVGEREAAKEAGKDGDDSGDDADDAAEAAAKRAALDRYTGLYTSDWGDSAVVHWQDGLAVVWLPASQPADDLTKLRPSDDGEHRFRRLRDDDTLGEEFVFEIGPDGRATRYSQHGNWMVRRGDLP